MKSLGSSLPGVGLSRSCWYSAAFDMRATTITNLQHNTQHPITADWCRLGWYELGFVMRNTCRSRHDDSPKLAYKQVAHSFDSYLWNSRLVGINVASRNELTHRLKLHGLI